MKIRTSKYEGYDVRTMAVGCLHILLSHAIPSFPGTSVAHPSMWVIVTLAQTGPLSERYKGYFPYKIVGTVWQNVVVPVLEDPVNQIITQSTTSLRVKMNQALVNLKDYEGLITKIEAALIVQLKVQGMVQPDAVGAGGEIIPEAPAPGEPIVEPDMDPLGTGDDLVWPEGHPILIYPIVV